MAWGSAQVQKPWLKSQASKWKGSSKGWGKGQGNSAKVPQPLPANLEVDSDARYSGVVERYYKWSGYGFITFAQKGVVPGDTVYVHYRNIQSDDRYPYLAKGMQVEFGLLKKKEQKFGVEALRARTVTLPGGGNIALQDDADAEKKTFVGGQWLRYTGTLKFYNAKRGFGWLTMDDGYALTEPVPKELRIEEHEVNCAGKKPRNMESGLAVEFGIQKTRKEQFVAYNMTLPGGLPLLQSSIEHRQELATGPFSGTIQSWSWKGAWGFVAPAANVRLPNEVQAKITQMQQAAKAKGKTDVTEKLLYFRKNDLARGCKAEKGLKVTFKCYIDDKGAGAFDITA